MSIPEPSNTTVKSISTPDECDHNPCNPFCFSFSEVPTQTVINVEVTGFAADWSTGTLADFPPGLVKKGITEPCATSADCQFDTRCMNPITVDPSGKTFKKSDDTKSKDESKSGSTPASPPAPDPHSKCSTGDALQVGTDNCVDRVCSERRECCTDTWDDTCVSLVGTECHVECGTFGSASCVPRDPGAVDESCDGLDLSVAPVCDDGIPVCNHGTQDAPAGLRLIHFPGNSRQYPQANPDQAHPQMKECFTVDPIPAGECIMVTGCPGLTGNREVMVNPPDASRAAKSYHVTECNGDDNWSLRSNGVDCKAATCEPLALTTEFVGACRFSLPSADVRDGDESTLSIRMKATDPATLLPRLDSEADCVADGWYFEKSSSTFHLCSATCDALEANGGGYVDALLACASGGFEVASLTEDYVAECDDVDAYPQWGFLTYSFQAPGDSRAVVFLRAAKGDRDLEVTPWIEVAEISRAAGNETCLPTGTDPCAIDVYALLGAENTLVRKLEVMIEAIPSSNGNEVPVLQGWNVSYSCLDAF